MPSMVPPTRRVLPIWRARRVGLIGLVTCLALLAGAAAPASAGFGFQVGVSTFHTPTWGTNHLPDPSPFSAKIMDIAVDGDTAYIGGEFDALAPTITLAGAIDGSSGLPQPGFPKLNDGRVNVAVPDGAGGWFIGGSFSKINDVTKNGIAHVLQDGSLDQNFDVPLVGIQKQIPGNSFTVWALARVGNYLYMGGEFVKFGPKGTSPHLDRNHIARVSAATGTVDGSWDPNTDGTKVTSIAASPDGHVYFAGDFANVGGQPHPGVAAVLGGTGAPLAWQPPVTGVSALAVSPDGGRIFVGGNSLAAVDPNGGVAWTVPSGAVRSIALSRDGATAYIGGLFSSFGGQPRKNLAAVDVGSGAIDTAWGPDADSAVSAVSVADDGTKIYAGGDFTTVRGVQRNHLAALDPTGTLEPWDPNANGVVVALSASGSQVYAGGDFIGLGSQPRTKLAAINIVNGGLTNFNHILENLGASAATNPIVIQAMALSTDHSRLYIAGNFDHVDGVPRTNVAAINLTTDKVDPTFDVGEPQGTVRSLMVRGNRLFMGGDFDSIRLGSAFKTRSDFAPCQAEGNSRNNPNQCFLSRSLVAAVDTVTGAYDTAFHGPDSTGAGLQGHNGKPCTVGAAGCGNGTVQGLAMSADGRNLFLSGSFTNMGGQLGLLALSMNGMTATKSAWQPLAAPGKPIAIPIFDLDMAPNGMLLGAGGGAGGRIFAWNPNAGDGTPAWTHLFDGDSTAVAASPTAAYSGGHYDHVEGATRHHASAFSLATGELAQNWDPAMDTSEGVFTNEVVPGRMVLFGGNFSRVNRRPQPGFAEFQGTP